jgi:ribosomal protein S18
VDYKDYTTLRRFMSERGKIRSRRTKGACRRHQRHVALAIKRARESRCCPTAAAESRRADGSTLPGRARPLRQGDGRHRGLGAVHGSFAPGPGGTDAFLRVACGIRGRAGRPLQGAAWQ